MKITNITLQAKNQDRVNVSVDGTYRFSLEVYQVTEFGIKIGNEYSEEEISLFEQESIFGKLYARSLEYVMMRPRSAKEVRDYLWRKTRTTRYKSRSGEIKERAGVSQLLADRVFDRLVEKNYIDDERFARFWVENRNMRKGASKRKLQNELRSKSVDQTIIDQVVSTSSRTDDDEIDKVIAKKGHRYDELKLVQYLVRQGYDYDLVRTKVNQFIDSQYQEQETD